MCAVAVKAEGLAEAEKEAGECPGKSTVVVAADEDKEEHQGLEDGEIGLGEKLGFGQRLFGGEAVFS
jgi:hypothetical protein